MTLLSPNSPNFCVLVLSHCSSNVSPRNIIVLIGNKIKFLSLSVFAGLVWISRASMSTNLGRCTHINREGAGRGVWGSCEPRHKEETRERGERERQRSREWLTIGSLKTWGGNYITVSKPLFIHTFMYNREICSGYTENREAFLGVI